MDKKTLRKTILEQRAKISDIERDHEIINRLLASSEWKNAGTVMLSASFGTEINTAPIINNAINSGKTVLLPVCVPDDHSMIIREINNYYNDTETGFYGIPEPKAVCPEFKDFQVIDFVLVPGITFTKKGYRLGYGGGYYDRFLSKLSEQCETVGIVREDLLSVTLPVDQFDIPVKIIFTEKRRIDCTSF